MRLVGRKPCNTSMRPLLVVKLNELLYLFFCFVNITKIYLPVGRKFFFNGSVYSFRYGILQRVAGLCHTDLYVLFLQKLYVRMAAVLHASVAMMYQRLICIPSVFQCLF